MKKIVSSSFVCPYIKTCSLISYATIEEINQHMMIHWKNIDYSKEKTIAGNGI